MGSDHCERSEWWSRSFSLRMDGVLDPDITQCYRWVMKPQFDAGKAAQKAGYLGKLFPALFGAAVEGMSFLEFFRTDRKTGGSKGVVAVDLGGADDQE